MAVQVDLPTFRAIPLGVQQEVLLIQQFLDFASIVGFPVGNGLLVSQSWELPWDSRRCYSPKSHLPPTTRELHPPIDP